MDCNAERVSNARTFRADATALDRHAVYGESSCLACPARLPQVPLALKVHPHLGPRAQPVSETPRRIRSDATLATDDLVETGCRNLHMPRVIDLRKHLRLEVLFQQHLARMRRRYSQFVDRRRLNGSLHSRPHRRFLAQI